jgi:HTH-type transcriptional regulator/antitoxin HigA
LVKARTTKPKKDTYLELIYRFPLRPIRSDEELDAATAVIDELLDRDRLDDGAKDYLDVLSDLVERYEAEAWPIEPVSDAVMLRHLLEAKGVSQAQAARQTGIAPSTISEILAGTRTLTRGQIQKLCAYFNVGPGVFIDASRPGVVTKEELG